MAYVLPPDANLRSWSDCKDGRRHRRVEVAVASNVPIADACDGVVAVWHPDADVLTLVGTVDLDTLSDGMGLSRCGEGDGKDGMELHVGKKTK